MLALPSGEATTTLATPATDLAGAAVAQDTRDRTDDLPGVGHRPRGVTVPMDADAAIDLLTERMNHLEARNVALTSEVEALRAAAPSPTPGPPPAAPVRPGSVDRRGLLRNGLAAAGVAAAGAVLLEGRPAAADDGDFIKMGDQSNAATNPTGMAAYGANSAYGFGVTDAGTGVVPLRKSTIYAHARGLCFDMAFSAIAEGSADGGRFEARGGGNAVLARAHGSGSGVGVYVEGNEVLGVVAQASGSGARALFVDGFAGASGAEISGATFDLLLHGGGTRGAPTDGATPHKAGEIVHDGRGTLWYCTAPGTPGTWRRLSGPAAAGAFHVLPTPARIYDSRPGTAPASVGPKTPFSPLVPRTFDFKANGSGVPAGATAALVTLLLVNAATGNGNLTLWANGVPKPASNTLVWGGDAGRFTVTAVTALDAQARAQVDTSNRTDLVIDVVGYYR